MKKKATTSQFPPSPPSNTPPVIVAMPNTIEEKMRAMTALARAIENLSDALKSTHMQVTVQDCFITSTGSTPAVTIGEKIKPDPTPFFPFSK